MKSRKEYFNSRILLMFLAFVLYCLSFFLLQLCLLVKSGYVTSAVQKRLSKQRFSAYQRFFMTNAPIVTRRLTMTSR